MGQSAVRVQPALRGHLDQVDFFRITTFAAVVAVHAFAFTNPRFTSLVVTMQIYVQFPLLHRGLTACRGHRWLLLGGLLPYQIVVLIWLHAGGHDSGIAGWYARYPYLLLLTYLLYIVAGAVAAQHLDRAQPWLVAACCWSRAWAVAASEIWYLVEVPRGVYPGDSGASDVLQPMMLLDSFGVLAVLAVTSCWWAPIRERQPKAMTAETRPGVDPVGARRSGSPAPPRRRLRLRRWSVPRLGRGTQRRGRALDRAVSPVAGGAYGPCRRDREHPDLTVPQLVAARRLSGGRVR